MQKLFVAVAAVFMVFVAWILYMADTNQTTVFFEWVRHTRNGDKYGHVLLFGGLTLVLILASGFRCLRAGPLSVYLGSLGMLVFVSLEELSQALFPERTLDIYDYLASVVGVVVFSLLAWLCQWLFFRRGT